MRPFIEPDAVPHAALPARVARSLRRGVVIPAHPLALTAARRLDEQRQRALTRYYTAAGAGGIAVGVHTTQFAIRDPKIGLFRPVLELTAQEMDRADRARDEPLVRISGICGDTGQALAEAQLARELGYHAGLLSLRGLGQAAEGELIDHSCRVSEVLPIIGFYLQEAVGGRFLRYRFWRSLCDAVPNLVAVKIAPFNRYRTLDVVRAVAESGRNDVALYTGNDDNILLDLLTPYRFNLGGRTVERRIVGGLLGQWAVWTKAAVDLLDRCHGLIRSQQPVPADLLALAIQLTDANAAVFDAANGFAGVIAGVHEVLRRQGLLAGTWCLDEHESLGPGQAEELTRITRAYPHLTDDAFVAARRAQWLADDPPAADR